MKKEFVVLIVVLFMVGVLFAFNAVIALFVESCKAYFDIDIRLWLIVVAFACALVLLRMVLESKDDESE